MKKTFANLFYSIRPSASFGAALLALGGLDPQFAEKYKAMMIFVAIFFGSCICFLFNDWIDKEKDLLNNKYRPIASGQLSNRIVLIAIIVCMTIYVFLSFLLGYKHLILSLVTLLIFFVYPYLNNKQGFLANLLVALTVCIAILYGATLQDFNEIFYLLTVITFIIIFNREILLDVLDMDGDQKMGKSSFPIRYGKKKTKYFVTFVYLLLVLSLIIYVLISESIIHSSIFGLIALSVVLPLFLYWKSSKWELFNIRWSHVPLVIIVVAMFLR